MGVYDEIEVGERSGQVKCWESTLRTVRAGDKVQEVAGYDTYSIAMREGGFVNVALGHLMTWTDTPACDPIFDKYGSPFDAESAGLLGEAYIHGLKSDRAG